MNKCHRVRIDTLEGVDENQQWARAHLRALNSTDLHSQALLEMIRGLATYADAYAARLDSPIGHDYVIGEAWQMIAEGLLALLNGDIGNLDGGTVDKTIRAICEAAEVELEP